MIEFGKQLGSRTTPIPGLVLWDLPVHGDSRGWFKENWQREKMVAAGMPDFGPVQNNISFNDATGTTRGIHAEPWDKWVSVASGRVFGAWVDLRDGPTFGAVFTAELDPSRAIFVPRGVGNSYQTLEPDTSYVYLVNDHWSPSAAYTFLNLADETIAIPWPIALDNAEVSERDLRHPRLPDVVPVTPRRTLVIGANGQLGRALRAEFADDASVDFVGRDEVDLTAATLVQSKPWSQYGAVINAAAYTAVDRAETDEGRVEAWRVNVRGVAALARIARTHGLTLVHVSSDYVFDGSSSIPYDEEASFGPRGVYGQTKAAADEVVATVPGHYIVRTSWVIGYGSNFVSTMSSLAARGIDPRVVDDQVGRLTFTSDLARGIRHLLASQAPAGTYNLTGSGEPRSWAEVARQVFALLGEDPGRIEPVSTADYFASANGPIAPRPRWSVLDLRKIEAAGFTPRDADESLATYLEATP